MNEPIAARVTKPTYNRQQLLKNLENSRLARESSRFDDYLRREYQLKGRYFAERTTISNGKIGYLSSDYFEGQQIPVRSRAFVDEAGHIKWPNADGFVLDKNGIPVTVSANLKAGHIVDSYGDPYGRFTSPVENSEILPFNKRGLPYPEGYQNYHQYRILKDISVENVKEGFSKLSITDKQLLMADMEEFRFSFDDLANPQKGQIAKVFGQGGGTQIKMITSISWFEKLGLLREVK